jgi:molybdenum cofactor guanylyltransferase
MSGVAGLLLAGGQSRRMGGGDKSLLPLGSRPILAHIIDRARPQVGSLALNANGDPARFAPFGLPVLPDLIEGYAGPLAGVLTGLRWAGTRADRPDWIVTIATDTPFFPTDLVARMLGAVRDGDFELACAASGGRSHPVFGLWPVRLAAELETALLLEGMRKIDAWTARYRLAVVEFDSVPCDPFFNVNTPEDLARAQRLLTTTA